MLGALVDEVEALLDFWFGFQTEGFSDDAHRTRWFSGSREFDDACREHFGGLAARAREGELSAWLNAPRSCLAYVLLCDQIPRNIHRGTSLAFETDGLALRAARHGIEARMDLTLAFDERCFFYLPFEHSENLVDQHTCVGLFTDLRDATPTGRRHLTGSYLGYAQEHRDIIRRFGRFPHRNALLGRASTSEEREFLESASDFGQSPDT
jgi:uncharacterized protein (DUF924 family)